MNNNIVQAEEEKKLGNDFFRDKNFLQALTHYSKAIELDPNNSVYLGNRAQTYIQMGKYREALEDANKSLSLDNKWYKAYSRKAKILLLLTRFEDANTVCIMGLQNCKRVNDDEGRKILKSLKEEVKKALETKPKNGIDAFVDSVSSLPINEPADKLFSITESSLMLPSNYNSFNWVKTYGCLNERDLRQKCNELLDGLMSKCKNNQPTKEESEAITLMVCNRECFSRKVMNVSNLDQFFVTCLSYSDDLCDENLKPLLIMFGNIFFLMDPITRHRFEVSQKVKELLNDLMFVRNKSKKYYRISVLGFRLFYALFQNKFWPVIKQLQDVHIGKLCNIFLQTIRFSKKDTEFHGASCYLYSKLLLVEDEDVDKIVLMTHVSFNPTLI